mmetsp:Transcript_78839/g.191004  ORF Transcript_78839/g.191004 Transcript_78839/m.191004 type:complete len:456 (-) Transcript_78839:51-1418(-)
MWCNVLLWSLLSHAVPLAGSADLTPSQSADIPFDQLLQVIAFELQSEDGRAHAKHLAFQDFQDITDLDCVARLVYLMNETITTSRHIQSYQENALGTAGMFQYLLATVPQENTWIWLVTNAHRHLLECVHVYWSKVVALALDQHHCLVSQIRDVLLDAVVAWKKLQVEILAMQWNGFAFGVYSGVNPRYDRNSVELTDPQTGDDILNGTHPRSLAVGNMWIGSVRGWFERFTQQLASALIGLEAMNAQQTEAGATRLHHQDEHGSFVTYEFLRRKVFGQWAIDKGLLRGLIRHVWQPPLGSNAPISVADFGAGGGHYSSWLNETGLVQAYAFDGTHQAAELTGGVVQEVNLVEDMHLWRNFSWIMCLEVGEHIPQQYAGGLLRNLRHHAQEGLVMSWSDDWEGIGHVNCLSRDEFVAKVQNETGFLLDHAATEAIKASCEIEYISRTIAVFRAQT